MSDSELDELLFDNFEDEENDTESNKEKQKMNFEKIKKFINEKIFHKKEQRLLTPASTNSIGKNDDKIDLSQIFEYIENEKYVKDVVVSFVELEPKIRKKLIKKIEMQEKGNINFTHEESPLVEGFFSQEPFISMRRKNVKMNKIGQTIVTENLYIDVSASKNTNYGDLQYKEYTKKDDVEDIWQFSQVEDSYYRKIKKNGNIFIESASYGDEQKIEIMERLAQPSDNENIIKKYTEITGLSYIASEGKNQIANIIKAKPYIVNIKAIQEGKSGEIIRECEIIKIFKSKKECVVGYKPEMILLRRSGKNEQGEDRMFRLLKEGLYADNKSFKSNFEDKYIINKIELDTIKKMVKPIPFSLSSEAKKILYNGVRIKKNIKIVYEKGIEKMGI